MYQFESFKVMMKPTLIVTTYILIIIHIKLGATEHTNIINYKL